MIRRIGILLMVAMLLVGCQSAGQTAQGPKKTRVGLCVRNLQDAPEYYAQLQAGLEALEYEVVLEDCHNDQSLQDQKVQALAGSGYALLVVEPVMVTALENVVAAVKSAQIPVILLDREPETLPEYDKLYFVGYDLTGAGAGQAALLEQLNVRGDLNGDGLVSCMMLRGPQDDLDAQIITDGCVQGLQTMDTELLYTAVAQWTVDDGRAQCAQGLRELGPDLEVILCNDPRLAMGALEAVTNSGRIPGQDVYILAVGLDADLEQALTQGKVSGTVWPETHERVQLLVQTVQAVVKGEAVERAAYTEFTPWTLPQ